MISRASDFTYRSDLFALAFAPTVHQNYILISCVSIILFVLNLNYQVRAETRTKGNFDNPKLKFQDDRGIK